MSFHALLEFVRLLEQLILHLFRYNVWCNAKSIHHLQLPCRIYAEVGFLEAAGAAVLEFCRMVDECIDGIPTPSATAMSYVIAWIVFTSPWFAIMDLVRLGWNTLIFLITLQRLTSFGSLTTTKGLKPCLLLNEGPGNETEWIVLISWTSSASDGLYSEIVLASSQH